jgi:RNA polymerase sigma factor for flagellar operon FliA
VESGESLYLQHRETIERVIAFVCGRHCLPSADAEEFASEVRLKLIEDNYAVLRKYEGRSTVSTYLVVVVQRLLLDHRTRSWGKWRPSAEARRAGPVGVALDQLMSRDGLTFDDAYRVLTARFGGLERARLEHVAAAIPRRARRRFEPEDSLRDMPSSASMPDAQVEQVETQCMADRLVRAIRTHTDHLDANDQLLLRLRFEDGRTVPEIAAILQLEAKALYRRIDRVLADLRRRLEQAGVKSREVQDVLEHPEILEWAPVEERIPVRRPSHSQERREWP